MDYSLGYAVERKARFKNACRFCVAASWHLGWEKGWNLIRRDIIVVSTVLTVNSVSHLCLCSAL